ncbi:TPA: acyltransferase [Klebsiella pneumoniae]|nr:acyltransferase [Klebsiella pneumoniae]HBT0330776.1 acyltransferase [Klebsiella pneumoniae]HCM6861628.1 acyltransferase [Klebsiella pneumoniae]
MLIYLFEHRIRPPIFSKAWIKVWAKRIINASGLISILYRRVVLSFRGAKLGVLSIVGTLDLNGPCHRLSLGERSFIASRVHLALHDDIIIGNRVVINDGVRLLTASHDIRHPNWVMFKKKIVIHDYAWIATGAIILPGVTIGKGAVVGAGAIVARDVEPFTVVAGNPARLVSQRIQQLNYSPVDLCAPYEAWLGNPTRRSEK